MPTPPPPPADLEREPLARRWGARRLACALAGVALLAACSPERPKLSDEESTTSTAATDDTTTTTTESAPAVEVATAAGDAIEVFADATSAVSTRTITGAEATSTPGIPLVFVVRDRARDRIEVDLPVAPPGSTGWVRASDVSVATVPYRLEIALSQHRLRVYRGDALLLDEPVAIGATDRPTAGELLFVRELLQPPDGSGPYGAYAYGISGYAVSLASFGSGTGLVGIHGNGDPATLGQDVPTGSIHLTDDLISRLVNEIGLPLGTPVEILG